MNRYTIQNPKLNPSKVFILQKSELEKRFDPFFYSPLNKLAILENTKLPKKKLSEVAELKRGKFSHRPRNDERFFGGKYPFIQTGEIVKASNDLGKIEYSQTLNELGLSVSKLFDEEVLLITIAANIGDTAILDYPACFPDSIVAISTKDNNVSLKYLNVYFKFLKKYLENLAPSAAQKNLTLEQLAPTPVVIPSIENQNRIISVFDNYIAQKQNNEAEAEKLLSSIDAYLLNELGIKLPEPPENTLKNRMFTRTLSDILNKRIDPFFHQDKFINNLTAISDGKYPVKQLREIILGNLIKGSLPKQDEKDGECSVVQINSINADGTIALDDLLTAKNIFSKQQKLKIGDVLVVITGATIGKIAFWNYEGDYFLGGDIVKFQTNFLSDNAFVYHFLRCSLMQTEIKRNITGATNGHLAPEDISHLPIPIPPLAKQKEIAEHITRIRQQAQQLKDKTKELLKKASEEIEDILLH
ncbi:MAG: restriction endonuclease subunit S [Sphingobacteriales bacterium]|nr:restriction endonuclease subunit S [Sphingobacteriales bacterium]